jgi:probable ATP-dependent RNA helicase DDX4
MKNIERSGYNKPTPVQKYALPIIIKGRDLMGCAQTGSGKTAAFLLPLLHNILEEGFETKSEEFPQAPEAIIVAPTRELAIQIKGKQILDQTKIVDSVYS